MALKFMGTLTISAGTPKSLATVFPTFVGKPFNKIIIAQRRGNTAFVYIGDLAMTGEDDASFTIPPATAAQTPFHEIKAQGMGHSPVTIDGYKVDGSANNTLQVSGFEG